MISANFHIKVGQSLLRAASAQHAEDQVAADMETMIGLMKDRHFKTLFQSVSYLPSSEMSHKVLADTFHGKLNELTLKLLMALADQKALKYVTKVADVYRKNYLVLKGITEVTIRTAREFSPQEQLMFVQKLQSQKKKTVTVKFEVNPALVAGAQVFENSYLTDYSVKNYLETLQKHLTGQQLNS
jgi:ATP synthase F1 delta subunit